MASRTPLPPHLRPAFTYRAAAEAGLARRRTLASDLERPFRGVRALPLSILADEQQHETLRRDIRRLAHAYSLAMPPGAFFSHTTACVLRGLPVRVSQRNVEHLDVTVFHPHRHLQSRGIHGYSVKPMLARVETMGLMRVATAASTWAMMAAQLDFADVVALGDATARIERMPGTQRILRVPHATMAQLERAAFAGRRTGVGLLREALPLIRTGSASRPESHLRVALVDAGLPEPQLDVDVYADNGRLLGCSEMAYPEYRVAVEYEGDHHRTKKEQWYRDIEKHHDYADAGWAVVRITRESLYSRHGRAVALVRSALSRAGWRA